MSGPLHAAALSGADSAKIGGEQDAARLEVRDEEPARGQPALSLPGGARR